MTNNIVTPETVTETVTPVTPVTPTETVTVTAADGTTTRTVCLLPQYAKTPKRGAVRKKREPELLLAYLREQGPSLTLEPTTIATLVARGLPAHRIVNAVSDLKKYYGVPVAATRTGRKVTGYSFTL